MPWDPERYLTYADERGRPFLDLIARIDATMARDVVDLGCGPGNLTGILRERWPDARITGLDASPEMIARAHTAGDGVHYRVQDLRTWAEEAEPVDVVISNATLQWIPEHLTLLPALASRVRPGGWIAFQVPGNFDEPSHVLRRELAAEEPYAERVADVRGPGSHDPEVYLRALVGLADHVDVWETTYLHVLHGEDPVFTWVSGTGARPTLEALGDLRPAFEEEFKRRLRVAYPDEGHGVVLPFRRIFAVARVSS